ncbi:MAG: molecular chaperone DnaK [Dehalococcoidia bacterium]|nr:molecular chaperone DnaK [Dehalococcoidia bacterium]
MISIALGIDLGTTYTVASVLEEGRPRVIPNLEGQRLTPSVVALGEDGRLLVGQLAKDRASVSPGDAVFSIKRRMGSDYRARLGERDFTPEQVSSLILGKVKADAEAFLGCGVESAVVTVPAYFSDRQRQATKEAALLAGLEVTRIINEPTAAALAYGLDRENVHTILVWDLGGGTFDVSILELGNGIFEVRAVSGDTWLGGDDYDRRMMSCLALEYWATHGVEIPAQDKLAWQELKETTEKAKIELSTSPVARVRLEFKHSGGNALRPFETHVTRDSFQGLTADLVERMVSPTRQALADAGLEASDIDRVILVGGSSRMPAVRQKARELLGKEPYRLIDPDEVVAMGAAIQAGILAGQCKKVVLLDVIPLSLGVETMGGLFARIINRNTPLPASESQVFTTAVDDQTSVDVHVLQGEREMAVDNISLGEFHLTGIPALPRGVPKIEVTFDVDVDGIVHVCAQDLFGGGEESIKVVSSKDLYPEEMSSIVEEAARHADADGRSRERAEAGIILSTLVEMAERPRRKGVDPELTGSQEEIEELVARAKRVKFSGDTAEMREISKELWELLRTVGGGQRSDLLAFPARRP